MNNKLIALAVAGALTAPMMAVEAAPTAYGRMAVEWAQTSNSAVGTNDKNYMVDNKAGQFGFKGSEDLGGGLKAIYKMEFGIETSNNTSGQGADIFDRESMIGLKIGKSHTVAMGNLKSPYKYAGGVKYDSFAATSMQAREGSSNISGSGGAMSSGALGHGGFVENAIAYTGKFKPVTVSLATTALDDSESDSPITAISVAAKVGAFHFGFANISQDGCLGTSSSTDNCEAADNGTTNPNGNGINVGDNVVVTAGNNGNVNESERTKFFGSWSNGQHTVRLQLEDTETTAPTAGAVATETDYIYVNYQFKMGKHLVDVALGEKDDKRATAGADEDFSRLAYAYNFSKKTRVFAGIAESDLTNNSGTGTPNDWDTFSVGMQIKF